MLSLTTNIAIVPVVINTFGGFSLTSFISNILIMIPWPLALLFGIAALVLSSISFHLTFFVLPLLGILMQYELLIIRWFTAFAISMPAVFSSPFAITLYYGIVIILAYYYDPPAWFQKTY